jgi:integrase
LDPLRNLPLVKTQAEDLFRALNRGTVSTNVYLRRMHNCAWDMNWLLGPVVVRRHWPKIRFREKWAITLEEHKRIIEREGNPERRAFYEMCWHLGGSQSDIACLQAEDVDWAAKTISYERRKLKGRGLRPSVVRFGPDVEKLLVTLPGKGPLFPYLATVRANDRATEFGQRCRGLGIVGVTLHSYRYAWAERAGTCGFPERFAMQSLGHNSKAVHHGYARKALVIIPSLQQYEEAYAASQSKIIPLQLQQARCGELDSSVSANRP